MVEATVAHTPGHSSTRGKKTNKKTKKDKKTKRYRKKALKEGKFKIWIFLQSYCFHGAASS